MKTFKSKIGLLKFLTPLVLLTVLQIKNIGEGKFDIFLKVILIYSIIVTLIYVFTKYSIKGNILNIKGGFFIDSDIDILSIETLKYNDNYRYRKNGYLKSPILSNDCMEVIYQNGKSIFVSPNNKEEFVNEIRNINPNIQLV
jgi:hypothetical protein